MTVAHLGYVLEVDLDYLEQLHDARSDYPLAPETMERRGESPAGTFIVGHPSHQTTVRE